MTKASEQRLKLTVERTRAKLKQRELELEAAEDALIRERERSRTERADTIALLRGLTEQYGDPDWSDEDRLPEILQYKLMAPLTRRVRDLLTRDGRPARITEPAAATAPPAPQTPPRRLQAVPTAVHRVMVVPTQTREGKLGYRAICTCPGWAVFVETEADGWRIAQEHEGRPSDPARQRAAR